MSKIDAQVNTQISCENGIRMRRIDVYGIPMGQAKCVENAKCGDDELKNFVRLIVGDIAPTLC